MLNGLDLFSGIGGLTLALESMVTPIAYCENDRYAQCVLLSRMATGQLPKAPIWDDIRTLHLDRLSGARPDIIYGGFPCQDISVAGNGVGLAGERSGLFFEVLRLAKEIRPQFIFLENVPAIRTRGLNQIGEGLASAGYDCRWDFVSAQEVGAPHKRQRWFLLAHANRQGLSVTRRDEVANQMESGNEPELLGETKLWEQSPSDVFRMDDGVSPRTHAIRALGNAVVPLQAREAFKRLCGLVD